MKTKTFRMAYTILYYDRRYYEDSEKAVDGMEKEGSKIVFSGNIMGEA